MDDLGGKPTIFGNIHLGSEVSRLAGVDLEFVRDVAKVDRLCYDDWASLNKAGY